MKDVRGLRGQATFYDFIYQTVYPLLTIDSGDGPVAADDGGVQRQLKDEGTDIRLGVCIHRRDVDRVHVGSFTNLSIMRNKRRSIVVHIYEKYLQRSCATGRGRA